MIGAVGPSVPIPTAATTFAPAAVGPASMTLAALERAVRASWGTDTTCLAKDGLPRWTADVPARGQCGPTALVLQDLLGGDLLIADVTHPDEVAQVHYWNRMSASLEVDLTREQFGPEHVIGEPRVVVRPPGGPRAYTGEYELLRTRVLAALSRVA